MNEWTWRKRCCFWAGGLVVCAALYAIGIYVLVRIVKFAWGS